MTPSPAHDPGQPHPPTDPEHPGSGPMHVKRSPVAPGAELPDDDVPRQPHERDQSIDATADEPDPRIVQAKKDLDAGQMDTDMRVQPGLDAERRRQAVGGPAGQENPPRDRLPQPLHPETNPEEPLLNPDLPSNAAQGASQRPEERNRDAATLQPWSPHTPMDTQLETRPPDGKPPADSGGTRTPAGSNYGNWVPDRQDTLHPDLRHPEDLPLAALSREASPLESTFEKNDDDEAQRPSS